MSLVFPHNSNSSMQSEGCQADMCDPEDISKTLRTFQDQANDLYNQTTSFIEQLRSRGESINQLDRLESHVSEMAATSQELNNALQTADQSEDDSARALDDLIAERDHLQVDIENHQKQMPATQADVESQQRLLGFLQEECYRKMEDLCYMNEKLTVAKQEYQNEWADFKKDLTQHQNEKLGYQEDIDHVKDLTLARFIGMNSSAKSDSSEKELIRRIGTYRKAECMHRQLEQEIIDCEIKSKDLEDEIGDLISQKKNYWKRCLDLENCLDELNGEAEEREISLRPAPAHQDLTHLDDSDWSERQNEEDTDEYVPIRLDFGHTGKILHRCPKQTNIAINESLSNENESQEVSTSVDTGAFDAATDELVAKNSGADSAAPQHDPEPEQDPDEQGREQLQMQLPGKVVQKLSPQAQTSTHVAPPRTLEEPEQHTPFIAKLRKRVSGLSGSLRGTRSHGKVAATGSTKRIDTPKRQGRR